LTALGKTLAAMGRGREAVETLERALRIREASEQNPEPLAETRFALARALATANGGRARSRALATAARDGYRHMAGHSSEAAAVERWLVDGAPLRN